jgi:hypothetical protein
MGIFGGWGGVSRYLKGFTIGTVKEAVLRILGTDIPMVPDEYKITVTVANSKGASGLIAVLQDNFVLAVESRWEPFMQGLNESLIGQLGNIITTAATGKSLQVAVTSNRIWTSTLTETDPYKDVVQKCYALQELAVPSEPVAGGLLTPPGPSPFKRTAESKTMLGAQEGTRIDIAIGTFLKFKSVIVKSVSITYDTRMSEQPRGLPIAAKADITFETYQIMTKENLADAYDQPYSQDTLEGVLKNKINQVKNTVGGIVSNIF